LPEDSRAFYAGVTFDDRERIEYDGYYHEVFHEVGKERVLADVEAWVDRHLQQDPR
jgi:alpha-beta hydrolase superfamily lysophospholipase